METDSLTSLSSINIEGKCDTCRARDRNNFKKKQADFKAAKKAEKLKEMEGESRDVQLAIREFKNKVDLEKSLDGSSEMPARDVKRHRSFSSQNDPNIKVEDDNEPCSYDELIKVRNSVGKGKEEQKKGEASIGKWTLINGHPVNSKSEETEENDSAFRNAIPNFHTKSDSGSFTFGNDP